MLKKFLIILVILSIYVFYASKVLRPQEFKYFSLIDDGQSILYAKDFHDCLYGGNCKQLRSEIIERQFGRLRPLYWTIQSLFVNTVGINAQTQHVARVYVIGAAILVLLIILMIQSGSGFWGVIFGSAIFIGSFSFTENIVRLGPAEPYQVIFLALFSMYFLSFDVLKRKLGNMFSYFILSILFILLILIKETSIAIIPVIILVMILKKKSRKELFPFFAIGAIGLLLFIGSLVIAGRGTEVAYSSNYNANPFALVNNAYFYFQQFYQMTGLSFGYLLLAVIVLTMLGGYKKYIFRRNVLYWLSVFVFFSLIVVPWPFILQRYLLITMFSFSILISVITTELIVLFNKHFKISGRVISSVFNLAVLIVLSNIYFRGTYLNIVKTINYQNWYQGFTKFEFDQVAAISTYVQKGNMYINGTDSLDDWEVEYEIPLHLSFFYNQHQNLEKISSLNEKGYLFSRTSFVPRYALDMIMSKFPGGLVESKSYLINQIDPAQFKQGFFLRPIQTLENPPLGENPLNYYWEIRKIN